MCTCICRCQLVCTNCTLGVFEKVPCRNPALRTPPFDRHSEISFWMCFVFCRPNIRSSWIASQIPDTENTILDNYLGYHLPTWLWNDQNETETETETRLQFRALIGSLVSHWPLTISERSMDTRPAAGKILDCRLALWAKIGRWPGSGSTTCRALSSNYGRLRFLFARVCFGRETNACSFFWVRRGKLGSQR